MLAKTRGIVLHTLPYSDSTVVAKIYTEEFGLRSYLVNAAHSRRSNTRSRLLQPLFLVELIVYEKENRQLHRVKEIRSEIQYKNYEDMRRNSILLFLDEVLCHVIKEEEKNPLLFEFLHSSLQMLDVMPGSPSNFHLSFLLQLSKYLGFYPRGESSEFAPCFDLVAGEFVPEGSGRPEHLGPEISRLLTQVNRANYQDTCQMKFSADQRRQLLQGILLFYSIHIEGFPSMKSVGVLEEVLAEQG